ncbi:MAG: sulfurtransferase [Gammaproteobacteria bacterium]|nr:sulfurtransferase [Gammaproteobacteria bacterium]
MSMVNIAGYKFIPLAELDDLRAELMAQGEKLGLKGTILLSTEGINLSLAGTAQSIVAFKAYLDADLRFQDMNFRESLSANQPFRFLRVKLKKEIITMGRPEIQPEISRAPSISPVDFKQWLDEKRDITVLDTRNDYEVRFGTFENAKHFELDDFGQFPAYANHIPQDKPVVMFCTGGVRCEKAALHLLNEGVAEVYQLDGGILNYFSEVGGAHYQGECFVFDQRISVDEKLCETGTVQCAQCQGPVTKEQQTAPQYIASAICPACDVSALSA